MSVNKCVRWYFNSGNNFRRIINQTHGYDVRKAHPSEIFSDSTGVSDEFRDMTSVPYTHF